MFIMFKSTILGYFKYQQEVTNCVDEFMMFYKVLDQNSLDTVKKMKSINEMRTTFRELMLNDLKWYYQAKKSLNIVRNSGSIQNQSSLPSISSVCQSNSMHK